MYLKKKLNKTAAFTDIHWGKSNNSDVHNIDCRNYVNWFIEQVKADPSIDSIAFLGDWFDNRAAVNISTLNYSYYAAERLNELGLPVFFIIGNHDLYHRHTREVYSTINFHSFNNFQIINETTVIDDLGDGALFCPFLFHDEYPTLVEHVDKKTWWGHFEFKGFTITGYNMVMPTGPDHTNFKGPNQIFSGHFHKRQRNGNVCYIGNCFPHNFSDAGDFERGMMVYTHDINKVEFIDWGECPKFQKVLLSDLLSDQVILHENARVKCICDTPITYEENLVIRQAFVEDHKLREFTFEETDELKTALTSTESEVEVTEDGEEGESVDELMVKMLKDIDSPQIDSSILVQQYMGLKN